MKNNKEIIDDLLNKYANNIIEKIDINNFNKIVEYLKRENCLIIDDMIEDYLDIFIIPYEEFIEKINYLNKKYNNQFFYLAAKDLNYLEEIFNDIN